MRSDRFSLWLFIALALLQLVPHAPRTPLALATPAHGWVAVSETPIAFAGGDIPWLRGRPFRRVGKSVRPYQLR